MEKKRKITVEARKIPLAAAEEFDDIYWSETTEEERLKVLIDLRKTFFGGDVRNRKIKKVVSKYNLYEAAD